MRKKLKKLIQKTITAPHDCSHNKHIPNVETLKAIKDVENNEGLIKAENIQASL